MHRPDSPRQPDIATLTALLDRADAAVAAQREAYGTERDEDTAWRAAWTTWRTLAELAPAVRHFLTSQQPQDAAVLGFPAPPADLGRAA